MSEKFPLPQENSATEGYDSGTLGPELQDPVEFLERLNEENNNEIPSNVVDRESYVIAYDTRFQKIHERYLSDLSKERQWHELAGTLQGFIQEIPDIQIEAEYRAYADFARKYPEDFKKYLPEIKETTKNDPDKYRLDDIVESLDSTEDRLDTKREAVGIPTDTVVAEVLEEEKVKKGVPVIEQEIEKPKGILGKLKSWFGW